MFNSQPKMPSFSQEIDANMQLQKQQIDAQNIYNAPNLINQQKETQAIIIEQLDPSKVLDNLIMLFRGVMYNSNTGEIDRISEPIMNELGISRITLPLRGLVTLSTVGSSLDDKEINKLLIMTDNTIIDELTFNWKEFGIKDKSMNDMIVTTIINTVFPTLKRALGAGERKFWGTTTIENLSQQPRYQTPKKEGFWSKFKF